MLAAYLANRPTGEPAVFLIIAVVFFALSLAAAGITATTGHTNATIVAAWRALISGGLGCLALALLTH